MAVVSRERSRPDRAIEEAPVLPADVDPRHPVDGLGRRLFELLGLVADGDLDRFEQVDPVAEPMTDAIADRLGGVVDGAAAVDFLEHLVKQHGLPGTRTGQVARGGGEERTPLTPPSTAVSLFRQSLQSLLSWPGRLLAKKNRKVTLVRIFRILKGRYGSG